MGMSSELNWQREKRRLVELNNKGVVIVLISLAKASKTEPDRIYSGIEGSSVNLFIHAPRVMRDHSISARVSSSSPIR